MRFSETASRAVRLAGLALVLVSLAPFVAGCAHSRQRELENVAKDWCMTIRASQVVPVYPLTEDLQPGDVFLVQIPVQRQEQLYRKRGFLPLDQMVTRLHDLDYASFYRAAYLEGHYADVPHPRPAPEETDEGDGEGESEDDDPGDGDDTIAPDDGGDASGDAGAEARDRRYAGARMPMAAFPSYSFSVDRSSGLRVAVPIQGVPVGLGLMQADRATGTVTISDGLTYGIDSEEALGKLRAWASRPEVRHELSQTAGITKGPLYLRVVTRVYFAGAMNVLLQNARSSSTQADVAKAQAIELPVLRGSRPAEMEGAATAYGAALAALSEAVNESLPGGSVKLAFASERAVGMSEEFPRPLAVGYLGFDVVVNEDGTLGPPVATRDLLDPDVRAKPVAGSVRAAVVIPYLTTVYETLTMLPKDPEAARWVKRLDEAAPILLAPAGRIPAKGYSWNVATSKLEIQTEPLGPGDDPKFRSVPAQFSRDLDYRRALRFALDAESRESGEPLLVSVDGAEAAPATEARVEELRAAYRNLEAALEKFETDLRSHPDVLGAVEHHTLRFGSSR